MATAPDPELGPAASGLSGGAPTSTIGGDGGGSGARSTSCVDSDFTRSEHKLVRNRGDGLPGHMPGPESEGAEGRGEAAHAEGGEQREGKHEGRARADLAPLAPSPPSFLATPPRGAPNPDRKTHRPARVPRHKRTQHTRSHTSTRPRGGCVSPHALNSPSIPLPPLFFFLLHSPRRTPTRSGRSPPSATPPSPASSGTTSPPWSAPACWACPSRWAT